MKLKHLLIATTFAFTLATALAADAPKDGPPAPPSGGLSKKGPPPGGKKGGPGGPSQESAEMQALLKSFNLTPEQQAKYAAARKETSEKMRAVSKGKADGTMPQPEVLKQALAAHKAYNAAVKEILSPEQYGKWLPLRESDHHKIAQAHKERDAGAAKGKASPPKPPGGPDAATKPAP